MSNQKGYISLIPKAERFSAYSYIKNEFFNVDEETFYKIANLYYDLYGYGPYTYLLNTYHSWKSGYVNTSKKTLFRIIECVPRFLSDEKRFIILKKEIIPFIEKIHTKQQGKNVNLSELNNLYENYVMQIENFNQSNLTYMVSKDIFSKDEIEEFLNVCKYILFEKLKLTFSQVQTDLVLIKEKLSNFRNAVFEAVYKIDFLNSRVDLANIYEINFDFITLKRHEINIKGTYKKFAEEYILEEKSKINLVETRGKSNYLSISKDLESFLNDYHQAKFKEDDEMPNSTFRGEAGTLNLTFEVNTFNLKDEVLAYIKNIHRKQQNKKSPLSDLGTLFENYLYHIETFSPNNLSFLSKRKFTSGKIEQFTMVCKYALLEKLNLAYRQVQNDIALIKSKLSNFNTGIFDATYQIDFLNSTIDLSAINETELDFIQLPKLEINMNSSFKKFAEQYILEEFMQMSFSQKAGEVNHFIKAKDLDFFISQYHEIIDSESEALLKSEFKGEGGQLNLTLEIKSPNKIKGLIFFSSAKLLLYSSVIIAVVVALITFELYKRVALIIFVGLMAGGFILNAYKTEIKKIINLKIDLRRYGKKQ